MEDKRKTVYVLITSAKCWQSEKLCLDIVTTVISDDNDRCNSAFLFFEYTPSEPIFYEMGDLFFHLRRDRIPYAYGDELETFMKNCGEKVRSRFGPKYNVIVNGQTKEDEEKIEKERLEQEEIHKKKHEIKKNKRNTYHDVKRNLELKIISDGSGNLRTRLEIFDRNHFVDERKFDQLFVETILKIAKAKDTDDLKAKSIAMKENAYEYILLDEHTDTGFVLPKHVDCDTTDDETSDEETSDDETSDEETNSRDEETTDDDD